MDTNELVIQVNKAAEIYRRQLELDGVNASGALSTFTTEYEYDGQKFILYFNLVDYWKYAENGRSAGKFPPIDAIENWVNIKPVIPVPNANGKVPSTKQLAFLISRKIAREGTVGKHSLKKAVESPEMEEVIEGIKSALVAEIKEEIIKNINDIIK